MSSTVLLRSKQESSAQHPAKSDAPLSTDEAAEAVHLPAARAGRILERFRATGVVERVPRTDRLATSLWSAMVAQHERRGADWLLLKGGFQRLLSEEQHQEWQRTAFDVCGAGSQGSGLLMHHVHQCAEELTETLRKHLLISDFNP